MEARLYANRCIHQKPKSTSRGTFLITIPLADFPNLKGADKAFMILQGPVLGDVEQVELVFRENKGNLEAFIPALWTPQEVGFQPIADAFLGTSEDMILINIEKEGQTLMVFGEDL